MYPKLSQCSLRATCSNSCNVACIHSECCEIMNIQFLGRWPLTAHAVHGLHYREILVGRRPVTKIDSVTEDSAQVPCQMQATDRASNASDMFLK